MFTGIWLNAIYIKTPGSYLGMDILETKHLLYLLHYQNVKNNFTCV